MERAGAKGAESASTRSPVRIWVYPSLALPPLNAHSLTIIFVSCVSCDQCVRTVAASQARQKHRARDVGGGHDGEGFKEQGASCQRSDGYEQLVLLSRLATVFGICVDVFCDLENVLVHSHP